MLTTIKAALATTATAALLCWPTLAAAGLTPTSTEAPAALAAVPAVEATPLAERSVYDQTPSFALSGSELEAPLLIKLRANSDLALWNLVATVHAQQKNKVFDLVDASTKMVWNLEREGVSAVPLPGVMWLFVLAVLGLAGNRIHGAGGAGREGRPLQPAGLATA